LSATRRRRRRSRGSGRGFTRGDVAGIAPLGRSVGGRLPRRGHGRQRTFANTVVFEEETDIADVED